MLSGDLLVSGMLSRGCLGALGATWGGAFTATDSLIPMVELNPCILYPLGSLMNGYKVVLHQALQA